MLGTADREDAFLGARLLLVAPRARERRVETVFLERLPEPHRLHDMGVHVGAVRERADALIDPVLIDVDEEIEAELSRHPVAKLDHLAELPFGIYMQEWKWRLGGVERLHRQVQQYRGVLADRVKHDRIGECCNNFSNDMDRFGFKPPKMGKRHIAIPLILNNKNGMQIKM